MRARSRTVILLGLTLVGQADLACSPVYGASCTDDCSEPPPCAADEIRIPETQTCGRPCETVGQCDQSKVVAQICGSVDGGRACIPAQPCKTACGEGFVCTPCAACGGGCSGQKWCFPENDRPAGCGDLDVDGGL